MMEISACGSAIFVVQTQFCIRDSLPVDTRYIEFEEEVLEGRAVVYLQFSICAIIGCRDVTVNIGIISWGEGQRIAQQHNTKLSVNMKSHIDETFVIKQ
jgi:hypothetical protein